MQAFNGLADNKVRSTSTKDLKNILDGVSEFLERKLHDLERVTLRCMQFSKDSACRCMLNHGAVYSLKPGACNPILGV